MDNPKKQVSEVDIPNVSVDYNNNLFIASVLLAMAAGALWLKTPAGEMLQVQTLSYRENTRLLTVARTDEGAYIFDEQGNALTEAHSEKYWLSNNADQV